MREDKVGYQHGAHLQHQKEMTQRYHLLAVHCTPKRPPVQSVSDSARWCVLRRNALSQPPRRIWCTRLDPDPGSCEAGKHLFNNLLH